AYLFEGLGGYTPTPDADCFAACPRDATKTVDVPTNAIVELANFALTPLGLLCGPSLPKGEYDIALQPLMIGGATTCGNTSAHISMP
ncbi:MAG TPA: hypothetical protein VFZ61_17180, partial [Polyangiales bacterium]